MALTYKKQDRRQVFVRLSICAFVVFYASFVAGCGNYTYEKPLLNLGPLVNALPDKAAYDAERNKRLGLNTRQKVCMYECQQGQYNIEDNNQFRCSQWCGLNPQDQATTGKIISMNTAYENQLRELVEKARNETKKYDNELLPYEKDFDDERLCSAATINAKWHTTRSKLKYVVEAKRRRLTCGVEETSDPQRETKPPVVTKKPTPNNGVVPKSPESQPPPVIAQKPKQLPRPEQPTRPKVQNGEEIKRASSGSGFAVSSDGFIMTNNHVINGCKKVFVHSNGRQIPAAIVTYDQQNDLALLKADFKPDAVFPLSADRPEILQDIYVAGYPFGMNVSTSVKVTKGIISSLTGIGNNFSEIQIDAALQSGNSGGPILDEKGNVVGVAVSKLDVKYALKNFGAIPENTNFGIKSSVVGSILDSNGVNMPDPNQASISKSDLGKRISRGTYYISCWMTVAQIEAMRAKKVMFEDIQ